MRRERPFFTLAEPANVPRRKIWRRGKWGGPKKRYMDARVGKGTYLRGTSSSGAEK